MITINGFVHKNGPKVILRIGHAVSPGQKPKKLVKVTAVVDTAASAGCIAPSVFRELGLVSPKTKPLMTGEEVKDVPVHSISIRDGVEDVCLVCTVEVSEHQPLGIAALVGQDFLGNCVFRQDGPAGTATYVFPT